MTRKFVILGFLVATGTAAAIFFLPRAVSHTTSPARSERPASERRPAGNVEIVAPGVVEAASEEVAIHAEIPGRLISVAVQEGDRIAARQIIAKLDDALARSHVEAAEADVKLRGAELTALVNGANQLQRREVWVQMKEAEAVVAQARADYARRQALF